MIEKIEQIAFGHFQYLPKLAGRNVHKSEILTIINCGLESSLFNIVCDTHLEEWARSLQDMAAFTRPAQEQKPQSFWDRVIPDGRPYLASQRYGEDYIKNKVEEVIQQYKGQPFAWWVGPSCDPYWLPNLLVEMGFKKVTTEHAMALDLNDYNEVPRSEDLSIQQVIDSQQLEDFITILEPYDSSARAFYENLSLKALNEKETVYVGYYQNTPAIIGILFQQEDTAGIFSLLTDEKMRGKGFGTNMMNHLIQTATSKKCRFVTLSASSDSGYRIYERLGFKTYGEFHCLEWEGTCKE